MKKGKIAFKGILFVAVILCICVALQPLFQSSDILIYGSSVKTIGHLPKDTLDVVFVGGSTYLRGIAPAALWEERGIVSYNLSTANQPSWLGYVHTAEMLKRQSPKLVVLEVKFPEDNYLGPEPAGTLRRRQTRAQAMMDYLPMSAEKLRVMYDCAFRFNEDSSGVELFAGYLVPVLANKSRWSEISPDNFDELSSDSALGQKCTTNVLPGMPDLSLRLEEPAQIEPIDYDEPTLEYSKETIQLLLDNDVQVCLMLMPSRNWTYALNKATGDLAKEYGIQYVDLNLADHLEAMGVDYETDFNDPRHLNLWGSHKASKYLAEKLDAMYDLPDGRGVSPIAAEMDESLAVFQDALENVEPTFEDKA